MILRKYISNEEQRELDRDTPKLTTIRHPNTLDKIRKGTSLGGGANGDAYLFEFASAKQHETKPIVYKIYKGYSHSDVKIIAARWNAVYRRIYNGKYCTFAQASAMTVDDKAVLITPFIESTPLCVYENWPEIRNQFKKQTGKVMGDIYNVGNFRRLDNGDILPIDFDCVVDAPPHNLDDFQGCCDFFCCFLPKLSKEETDLNTKLSWAGHALHNNITPHKITARMKDAYHIAGQTLCLRDNIISQLDQHLETLSFRFSRPFSMEQPERIEGLTVLREMIVARTGFNSRASDLLSIINEWETALSFEKYGPFGHESVNHRDLMAYQHHRFFSTNTHNKTNTEIFLDEIKNKLQQQYNIDKRSSYTEIP